MKHKLTKENAAAAGRKGGVRSGEIRRQNKEIRTAIMNMMRAKSFEDESGNKINGFEMLAVSLAKKVQSGDIPAMVFLRDTIGEKPVDEISTDNTIRVVFDNKEAEEYGD